MKKICILLAIMLLFTQFIFSQQNAVDLLLNNRTTVGRNFTTGSIPKADMEIIVQAGTRSPSARNSQAWYFTVVQNLNLGKQLIADMLEGNAIIVVSANGDGKTNTAQILDAALAVQSINLAAQALGYGTRIYTGPIDNLNTKFKADFGLPQGYSAVALVRVGKVQDGVDALSTASPRKKQEELVTYK